MKKDKLNVILLITNYIVLGLILISLMIYAKRMIKYCSSNTVKPTTCNTDSINTDTFDVSVYQPKSCKIYDGNIYITSDTSKFTVNYPYKLRWCAVSRELLTQGYNYGDTIVIDGTLMYDGKWVIHDVTNIRVKNRIDILIDNSMYVDLFKNCKITKL